MNIGDRVRYKTVGGWYNGGIIIDMDKDSCLIEVDTLGCERSSEDEVIQFPHRVRVLPDGLIAERRK